MISQYRKQMQGWFMRGHEKYKSWGARFVSCWEQDLQHWQKKRLSRCSLWPFLLRFNCILFCEKNNIFQRLIAGMAIFHQSLSPAPSHGRGTEASAAARLPAAASAAMGLGPTAPLAGRKPPGALGFPLPPQIEASGDSPQLRRGRPRRLAAPCRPLARGALPQPQ